MSQSLELGRNNSKVGGLLAMPSGVGDTKKGGSLNFRPGAPSGARTLDPNIKSVVLYQLS